MSREIAIVGGGKVGTALGYLLSRKGFMITAVACRSGESAQAAQAYTGGLATTDVVEAARSASIVFISTKDDQIEEVCCRIAQGGGFRSDGFVFHFSGALSLDCLNPAKESGAATGSIHPLQSFADVEDAIEHLPGSFFGVTAPKTVLDLAREVVDALGGRFLLIKEKDKPLYHAAACVVSNYLVALLHLGEEIMSAAGISEQQAREAFWPLVAGTLENIRSKGTVRALTGPISRGDMGTLKMHLVELHAVLPRQSGVYNELGRYTAEIALKKGGIDRFQYELLNQLFSK